MASWNRNLSIAGSDASSGVGPKLRTSIPEQNPRPAPVMTTAFTDVSAATVAKVCVSSARIRSLIALSCPGRFSCSTTIPACGRSSIKVSVTVLSAEAVPAPAWR
jgi:hypothetical protein